MIQPKKIIAAILLILGSIFGGYQVADDVFLDDGTLVTNNYTILKSADFTRPIQADTNLQGKFFTDNVSRELYVHDQTDRIVISSGNKHYTRVVIKINYNVLVHLNKFNGNEIRVMHRGSNGLIDSEKVVSVRNKDAHGFVYIVADFSEVIIDGFVGTWEVTAYNLSVSDSLNFGQTFNASNVTSLPVNVTDDATKSHPYDINYTGCVLEWRADGDFNDTQGVNTLTGYDVTFDDGKYNEAGVFNLSNFSYVDAGNDVSLNITDAITIEAWVKPTDLSNAVHLVASNSNGIIGYEFGFSDLPYALRFYTGGSGNDFLVPDISLNTWMHIAATYSLSDDKIYYYLNGIQKGSVTPYGPIASSTLDLYIGRRNAGTAWWFNGSIDSVRIYNRALSEEEVKTHYYDRLEQLKIKTNSNSTWSTEWNSTSDNQIHVPYADGEFFSLLNFTVPDTVVQYHNGEPITIYNYPSTVRLDVVAIVEYTKDITKIIEEAIAGMYTLNVTHAAGNTGEGHINYTTANSVLLNADFWNAAVLTTDNPNASLSTTLPLISIDTGYVAATTEFYYLVKMPYFYPPTSLTATNTTNSIALDWDDMPNSDNYSVYLNNVFTSNATASNYTVSGLNPSKQYNLSVTTWNGSQQTSKTFILSTTNSTGGIFVNPDFVGDEGEFVNKWRTR